MSRKLSIWEVGPVASRKLFKSIWQHQEIKAQEAESRGPGHSARCPGTWGRLRTTRQGQAWRLSREAGGQEENTLEAKGRQGKARELQERAGQQFQTLQKENSQAQRILGCVSQRSAAPSQKRLGDRGNGL